MDPDFMVVGWPRLPCSSGLSTCCAVPGVVFTVCRCVPSAGLGNNCNPRYPDIMVFEGLEITQAALETDLSTHIHHRITIYNKMTKVPRCWYISNTHISEYELFPKCIFLCNIFFFNFVGEFTAILPSINYSDDSRGPPCTGNG